MYICVLINNNLWKLDCLYVSFFLLYLRLTFRQVVTFFVRITTMKNMSRNFADVVHSFTYGFDLNVWVCSFLPWKYWKFIRTHQHVFVHRQVDILSYFHVTRVSIPTHLALHNLWWWLNNRHTPLLPHSTETKLSQNLLVWLQNASKTNQIHSSSEQYFWDLLHFQRNKWLREVYNRTLCYDGRGVIH